MKAIQAFPVLVPRSSDSENDPFHELFAAMDEAKAFGDEDANSPHDNTLFIVDSRTFGGRADGSYYPNDPREGLNPINETLRNVVEMSDLVFARHHTIAHPTKAERVGSVLALQMAAKQTQFGARFGYADLRYTEPQALRHAVGEAWVPNQSVEHSKTLTMGKDRVPRFIYTTISARLLSKNDDMSKLRKDTFKLYEQRVQGKEAPMDASDVRLDLASEDTVSYEIGILGTLEIIEVGGTIQYDSRDPEIGSLLVASDATPLLVYRPTVVMDLEQQNILLLNDNTDAKSKATGKKYIKKASASTAIRFESLGSGSIASGQIMQRVPKIVKEMATAQFGKDSVNVAVAPVLVDRDIVTLNATSQKMIPSRYRMSLMSAAQTGTGGALTVPQMEPVSGGTKDVTEQINKAIQTEDFLQNLGVSEQTDTWNAIRGRIAQWKTVTVGGKLTATDVKRSDIQNAYSFLATRYAYQEIENQAPEQLLQDANFKLFSIVAAYAFVAKIADNSRAAAKKRVANVRNNISIFFKGWETPDLITAYAGLGLEHKGFEDIAETLKKLDSGKTTYMPFIREWFDKTALTTLYAYNQAGDDLEKYQTIYDQTAESMETRSSRPTDHPVYSIDGSKFVEFMKGIKSSEARYYESHADPSFDFEAFRSREYGPDAEALSIPDAVLTYIANDGNYGPLQGHINDIPESFDFVKITEQFINTEEPSEDDYANYIAHKLAVEFSSNRQKGTVADAASTDKPPMPPDDETADESDSDAQPLDSPAVSVSEGSDSDLDESDASETSDVSDTASETDESDSEEFSDVDDNVNASGSQDSSSEDDEFSDVEDNDKVSVPGTQDAPSSVDVDGADDSDLDEDFFEPEEDIATEKEKNHSELTKAAGPIVNHVRAMCQIMAYFDAFLVSGGDKGIAMQSSSIADAWQMLNCYNMGINTQLISRTADHQTKITRVWGNFDHGVEQFTAPDVESTAKLMELAEYLAIPAYYVGDKSKGAFSFCRTTQTENELNALEEKTNGIIAFGDEELKEIYDVHPYAAVLLTNLRDKYNKCMHAASPTKPTTVQSLLAAHRTIVNKTTWSGDAVRDPPTADKAGLADHQMASVIGIQTVLDEDKFGHELSFRMEIFRLACALLGWIPGPNVLLDEARFKDAIAREPLGADPLLVTTAYEPSIMDKRSPQLKNFDMDFDSFEMWETVNADDRIKKLNNATVDAWLYAMTHSGDDLVVAPKVNGINMVTRRVDDDGELSESYIESENQLGEDAIARKRKADGIHTLPNTKLPLIAVYERNEDSNAHFWRPVYEGKDAPRVIRGLFAVAMTASLDALLSYGPLGLLILIEGNFGKLNATAKFRNELKSLFESEKFDTDDIQSMQRHYNEAFPNDTELQWKPAPKKKTDSVAWIRREMKE